MWMVRTSSKLTPPSMYIYSVISSLIMIRVEREKVYSSFELEKAFKKIPWIERLLSKGFYIKRSLQNPRANDS